MTPEQVTTALRNLTMLVQFASLKGGLRDRRVNQLAVICENVQSLGQLAPSTVSAELVAGLCFAAKALDVDLGGKR